MHYLDTSLLVAALTNEARSGAVQEWLAEQATGQLAISDWVVTELSGALSIKVRSGQLGPDHRVEVLTTFNRLTEESFLVLSISRLDFHTAARFADQYEAGLRSGDALHLAVAANHGVRLVSLDRRLVQAGKALGVSTAEL